MNNFLEIFNLHGKKNEAEWWNPKNTKNIVFSTCRFLNKLKFKKYFSFKNKCRPLFLHVETVNICNFRCVICPCYKMTRKKEVMQIDKFRRIVEDYCKIGGGDVALTPQIGDVFLDRFFIERIRILKSYPAVKSIGFVTNGFAADVYNDEDIKYIINSCTRINVSIYGLNEYEYEVMTNKKNAYERVMKNLRRFINSNENNCIIVMAFRLLKKYSDEEIKSWMIDNFGKEFPFENVNKFCNWAGALDTSKELPLGAEWQCSEKYDISTCAYPLYHLKVMVNGDVKFCSCADYDNNPENTIGNVADSSLLDIYNSDLARRIWENGLKMCDNCTFYKSAAALDEYYEYLDSPIIKLGV